jgi:hypothetical protein
MGTSVLKGLGAGDWIQLRRVNACEWENLRKLEGNGDVLVVVGLSAWNGRHDGGEGDHGHKSKGNQNVMHRANS